MIKANAPIHVYNVVRRKWYDISADGGETWTTQYLSDEEVMETLSCDKIHMIIRENRRGIIHD